MFTGRSVWPWTRPSIDRSCRRGLLMNGGGVQIALRLLSIAETPRLGIETDADGRRRVVLLAVAGPAAGAPRPLRLLRTGRPAGTFLPAGGSRLRRTSGISVDGRLSAMRVVVSGILNATAQTCAGAGGGKSAYYQGEHQRLCGK